MIHIKLTSIPPANRRQPGRRQSSRPSGRPVWRTVTRCDGLRRALEKHTAWLRGQIEGAATEGERGFWEEALRRVGE